jgi:anti-sigma regulatory factor (Ser/Thr protein kinase)
MTTDSQQFAAAGVRLSIELPPGGEAAAMARHATRLALASADLGHLKDNVTLLVSELVGNAVRHARGGPRSMELRSAGGGDLLRIEVIDSDPTAPQVRVPNGQNGGGFGLVLVEALADGWGVRPIDDGKAVWFELRTAPPSSAAIPPAAGAETRDRIGNHEGARVPLGSEAGEYRSPNTNVSSSALTPAPGNPGGRTRGQWPSAAALFAQVGEGRCRDRGGRRAEGRGLPLSGGREMKGRLVRLWHAWGWA